MNRLLLKILNKKTIVTILFVLLFSTFLFPDTTFAFSLIDSIGDLVSNNAVDNTFGYIVRFIGWLFFLIGGVLSTQGAQFLDVAISFSLDIRSFSLDSVKIGWQIFRDITNMAFIFIILYIAFSTILNASTSDTKKWIANLIIAGLFVNFSFFITGAVIDAGNILGGTIYKSITPITKDENGNDVRKELGGILTEGLELSKVVDPSKFDDLTNVQMGIIHGYGGLFLSVSGFVFLSGAFLFVIRQVMLMFLLILSPLAFAATILPATQKHWQNWLNKLMENTFVAPLYLLFIAVVVGIINSGDILRNTGADENSYSSVGLLSKPEYAFSDIAGILLNYAILTGLLIASLIVAKNIASDLASSSSKWAGKFIGFGAGAAAFAGRNTAGRFSNWARQKEGLQSLAAKKGVSGVAGRLALRGANYGAGASYDARSGKVGKTFGATVGSAIGAANIDVKVGKAGGKGGYKKRIEELTKKETAFAKSLGVDKKRVAEKELELKKNEEMLIKAKQEGKSKEDIEKQKQNVEEAKEALQKEKIKRQMEHSERLQNAGIIASWATLRTRGTNKTLGDAVKKDAKKSKDQKLLDEIKNFSKEDKKDGDKEEKKD